MRHIRLTIADPASREAESFSEPRGKPALLAVSEMKKNPDWNTLYGTVGEELPWCVDEMPSWFAELVDSEWMEPCNALAVGCGLGNYAFYLAQRGYIVLCLDRSEEAISLAKEKNSHPSLRFIVESVENLSSLDEQFDLVYDISLLHHLKPSARDDYASQLSSLLPSGGKLMVCVFSEDEPRFGKNYEFMNPVTDTITYLLAKEELLRIFEPYFVFDKLEKIPFDNYLRYLCLMRKK